MKKKKEERGAGGERGGKWGKGEAIGKGRKLAKRGATFDDGEGKLLVSSELKRVHEERQSSSGGLSRWKTFEFASSRSLTRTRISHGK